MYVFFNGIKAIVPNGKCLLTILVIMNLTLIPKIQLVRFSSLKSFFQLFLNEELIEMIYDQKKLTMNGGG